MRKKRKNPEKVLENEIAHELNIRNYLTYKYNPMGSFDPDRQVRLKPGKFVLVGMADLLCSFNVDDILITIFLEVKTKTGKQSKIQKAVEKRLTRMGGHYYVVRSVDEALAAVKDAERKVRDVIRN